MPRDYCVYILASRSRELYVGVTNDLARRVAEHRAGIDPDDHAFRPEVFRLVFVERTGNILEATRREMQLKSWSQGDTNAPAFVRLPIPHAALTGHSPHRATRAVQTSAPSSMMA